MQSPGLGKTTGNCSPSAACMEAYRNTKTRQQEESFPVSSKLISLYSSTQVCCVFSHRVLSNYDGPPRTMAIVYFVLGATEASLSKISKGGNLCLELRLSLNNPSLLGSVLSTHAENICSDSLLLQMAEFLGWLHFLLIMNRTSKTTWSANLSSTNIF